MYWTQQCEKVKAVSLSLQYTNHKQSCVGRCVIKMSKIQIIVLMECGICKIYKMFACFDNLQEKNYISLNITDRRRSQERF